MKANCNKKNNQKINIWSQKIESTEGKGYLVYEVREELLTFSCKCSSHRKTISIDIIVRPEDYPQFIGII